MHTIPPGRLGAQQRLGSQGRQNGRMHTTHTDSSFPPKAAPKNRQVAESPALIGCKEAPRAIEDRPQAAVLLRHILHCSRQKIQVQFDGIGNLLAGKLAYPGSRKLDAQRHSINELANAQDQRFFALHPS